MEELLDVAVQLDGPVVALERLRAVVLQEMHAAQSKVGKRLSIIASYCRPEQLGCFSEVAVGGSERAQRKHVAKALGSRLAQVESCGKVLQCDDWLVGVQRFVALPVEERAAVKMLSVTATSAIDKKQNKRGRKKQAHRPAPHLFRRLSSNFPCSLGRDSGKLRSRISKLAGGCCIAAVSLCSSIALCACSLLSSCCSPASTGLPRGKLWL